MSSRLSLQISFSIQIYDLDNEMIVQSDNGLQLGLDWLEVDLNFSYCRCHYLRLNF